MLKLTKELLTDNFRTRATGNHGSIFVLDLRGPQFGPLGEWWQRRTLYDPSGAGWPLKRGASTSDQSTAEAWLDAYLPYLQKEWWERTDRVNGMATVKAEAERYIDAIRSSKGPTHNTVVNRTSIINRHIIPALGKEPLAALADHVVSAWIGELKVWSDSGILVDAGVETKKMAVATLRAIYFNAFPGRKDVPWGVVRIGAGDTAWHQRNNAALEGEILGADAYYTLADVTSILRHALAYDLELMADPASRARSVPNTAPFIAVLFYTGARRAEAALIRWKHVREDLGLIYLPGTKTESAPRWVPLQDELRPWIRLLRALAGPRTAPKDFLFRTAPNQKGVPCADTLAGRVEKALVRAGLKRAGELCHIFRDSHVTIARISGYDRDKLRMWLGHKHGDVMDAYECPEALAVQLLPEDRAYLPETLPVSDLEAFSGRSLRSPTCSRSHLRLIS